MKINDSHLPTYFQTEFSLIEISQPKKKNQNKLFRKQHF